MSPKLTNILLFLLLRLFGLCLVVFSFVFVLALFSFDVNDPSFNTVSTDGHVNNWLGAFGSHISDLSFQLIGLSSFFLALIIFSIGMKMSGREGVRNLLPKIILIPFCLLCFAVVFAVLPPPSWWEFNSLGGVNGHFILVKIGYLPSYATAILAAIFGLILISMIIEISLSDWIYFFRYSFISTRYLFEKLLQSFKDEPVTTPRQINLEEDDDDEEKKLRKTLKKKLQTIKTKKPLRIGKSSYQLPNSDLLTDRASENKDKKISKDVIENQSKMLLKVLEDFGVYGISLGAKIGPVVTLHEFEPAAGTKASRVIGLSDDIARSMSAISTRIAVVPGKTSIGIELPNPKREMIFLRELLECKEYKFSQHFLPIILGKDIAGETMIADLAKMPHLLIAGTTGSGKSVGLNVMILSMLYKLRPDECKFIMIDPKMLELSIYDGIPHLLAPVITESGRAITALKWVVAEMEERYRQIGRASCRERV